MEFKRLKIPDVILIEPPSFEDDRGFFYESYNKKEFDKIVGEEINFVQDNFSCSSSGVLRGIHYQENPFSQGKLVRVSKEKSLMLQLIFEKNLLSILVGFQQN